MWPVMIPLMTLKVESQTGFLICFQWQHFEASFLSVNIMLFVFKFFACGKHPFQAIIGYNLANLACCQAYVSCAVHSYSNQEMAKVDMNRSSF